MSEELQLISLNENYHCDQQMCWIPNIRCTTNSTTGIINISYSKKYLCLIITSRKKERGIS